MENKNKKNNMPALKIILAISFVALAFLLISYLAKNNKNDGRELNKENNQKEIKAQKVQKEKTEEESHNNKKINMIKNENTKKAYFSGGCFWCIEAPLQESNGVFEATSGYIGGEEKTARYGLVVTGKTRQRESVEVEYNSKNISYRMLVKTFLYQIDPTDDGGQFADRGFQYTTAIYYQNEEEKKIIEEEIKALKKVKKFDKKIATKIINFSDTPGFFEAEEYHQDYYKKASKHYKAYKKGSGRVDFIEENWAKEAAVLAIEKEKQVKDKDSLIEKETQKESQKVVTEEEIKNNKNFWLKYKPMKKEELKEKLTSLEYKVTQEKGTERAYSNELYNNKKEGIYVDIVSGEPLFSSTDKYDSGTGWPSFTKPIETNNLKETKDYNIGYERREISSKISNAHLGHIFPDGPKEKGGLRYCVNGASLKFIPKEKMKEKGYEEFLKLL